MDIKVMKRTGLAILVAAVGIIAIREIVISESGGEEEKERLPDAQMEWSASPAGKERKRTEFTSGGVFFQEKGCPYTLSKEEAKAVLLDDSEPGNTIALDHHGGGRTGNHYMTLSAYLAMGYCCRSRLLTLPQKDSIMPSEDGVGFSAEIRWFRFSNASLPRPEFEEMRDDPEVCRPHTNDGGGKAFGYENVHDKLLECMNLVYLRGCESAYLGKLVDKEAFCPKRDDREQRGAGSLVMHIRSGDIFDPEGEGTRRKGFGQPPLQYYLYAMKAKEWDHVTIVTAAWKNATINPTFTALEVMESTGMLGPNVRLFRNRSLLTDVRAMLCADGLAFSRSSLSLMIFPHTRARFFFVPAVCGNGLFRIMKKSPKAFVDNTTLLFLEKPDAEIHGIRWREDAPEYTVFNKWRDDPEQLLEIVEYGGIETLERCS